MTEGQCHSLQLFKHVIHSSVGGLPMQLHSCHTVITLISGESQGNSTGHSLIRRHASSSSAMCLPLNLERSSQLWRHKAKEEITSSILRRSPCKHSSSDGLWDPTGCWPKDRRLCARLLFLWIYLVRLSECTDCCLMLERLHTVGALKKKSCQLVCIKCQLMSWSSKGRH